MASATPPVDRCLPFLLAGGRGSRLHELTDSQCKPALPFGGSEGRIVDFILDAVVRTGFGRLMVATQYRPEDLAQHLSDHWATFLPKGLRVLDGRTFGAEGYRGTADPLRRNVSAIDALAPEEVMILSGDHVLDIDLHALLAHHRGHKQPVTVATTAVPLEQARSFGVFSEGPDGSATGFAEKPANPVPMPGDAGRALASTGIYVLDWEWLRAVLMDDDGAMDFGHDVLPRAMADDALGIYRLPDVRPGTGAYWRDVGTLEAYRLAWLDFLGSTPPVRLPHTMTGLPPARAHATVDGSVLMPGARLGWRCRLNKVIVAHDVVLPDGFVAGFDHAEDARWFRRDGETVLITSEMMARRAAATRAYTSARLGTSAGRGNHASLGH
ncbi:sugar phosphate nucleotidyltransferase [Sagittula salina]|uniref:NTP transferase domain-containing protein n=1 Tax=Sagittula salina TaxID=2820268 RepID=A0A940MQC5_9RHOB|nr:sugar phosphate nucleotidyltransferase [Sagittula salina]MBP0482172.1 NTP transferase domain-containing protein [Sagittula salina]